MYRPSHYGWYHCHCSFLPVHSTLPICSFGGVAYAQYGLVVSVLISGDLASPMPLYTGFIQLGAGLSVGLAGLAAGFAIGIVGDAGVRGTAQQGRLFVGMVSLPSSIFMIHRGRISWADSYSHFRRSLGSLRSHCRSYPQHQLWCRLHSEPLAQVDSSVY